jgi:thioredoxin reductase
MDAQRYDLLVIGSGPAGQRGAICAAKLGRKVPVIDPQDRIGGVSLHTGTIRFARPSSTSRGFGSGRSTARDFCPIRTRWRRSTD